MILKNEDGSSGFQTSERALPRFIRNAREAFPDAVVVDAFGHQYNIPLATARRRRVLQPTLNLYRQGSLRQELQDETEVSL